MTRIVLVFSLLSLLACTDDGPGYEVGQDPLAGRYAGDFECANLDADVAALTFYDDEMSGTLAFTPSAGGPQVVSDLTNLAFTEGIITFDAVFPAVPGESGALQFTFTMDRLLGGFEGGATLRRADGSLETCTAMFVRE
jgi:hypothetical protein